MNRNFEEEGHEVFEVEGTPEECYHKVFGHIYDRYNDRIKCIMKDKESSMLFDEIMSYMLLNWVNAACKDKGGINGYKAEGCSEGKETT